VPPTTIGVAASEPKSDTPLAAGPVIGNDQAFLSLATFAEVIVEPAASRVFEGLALGYGHEPDGVGVDVAADAPGAAPTAAAEPNASARQSAPPPTTRIERRRRSCSADTCIGSPPVRCGSTEPLYHTDITFRSARQGGTSRWAPAQRRLSPQAPNDPWYRKDMARVTSKLQVTIPKDIARRYGIEPGEEIDWLPAGDATRVVPDPDHPAMPDRGYRLQIFDAATDRQRSRDSASPGNGPTADRGWRREDLYDGGLAG
jgi:bifunctional DNA-binding transcriptional regulator/antitoxin component of YhaV-PrlF toxin-antitoxin module